MLELLFWLLSAHALVDFSLQPEAMAKGKNRHNVPTSKLPWLYWLSAHALEHGACVAIITGSIQVGIAEATSHWIIDYAKCENWIGVHFDQGLHLAMKIAWIAALWL